MPYARLKSVYRLTDSDTLRRLILSFIIAVVHPHVEEFVAAILAQGNPHDFRGIFFKLGNDLVHAFPFSVERTPARQRSCANILWPD